MKAQTFIFIGKSGCGKGTQVALLTEYLKKIDSRQVFHVETGAEFRKFIQGDTYSARIAKEITETGRRQPDFLAINLWGQLFINTLEDDEYIICDGCPRSRLEAEILNTAFKFYKRGKPIVIYLNVTHESVKDRLLLRGRSDDHEDAIKNRLKFYEDDVLPAVEYFRNSPDFTFLDIDGEPSIEVIHKDILSKLEVIWQSQ